MVVMRLTRVMRVIWRMVMCRVVIQRSRKSFVADVARLAYVV